VFQNVQDKKEQKNIVQKFVDQRKKKQSVDLDRNKRTYFSKSQD
jgi:hypothetical protein